MIHANELRVGNKVFYKPWDNKIAQNQIVTISWVSDDSAGHYEQHEASYPHAENEYSPIPLTPEILEKCGFVQTSAATFGNGIIGIYFGEGEYFYYHGKGKYLHQLQNLFWGLCREELQVKGTLAGEELNYQL
jgi:hypothetical protein